MEFSDQDLRVVLNRALRSVLIAILVGIPIIWVNDHCVVVPLMMFMMFCQVGHIEANGDLFKHMRDPGQH